MNPGNGLETRSRPSPLPAFEGLGADPDPTGGFFLGEPEIEAPLSHMVAERAQLRRIFLSKGFRGSEPKITKRQRGDVRVAS
jgi:hypothetical protein